MRVVVAGGTGRVGAALVATLRLHHVEVAAAARSSGIDTCSGAGVDEVVQGAAAVVDVTDPRALDDDTVLRFFRTSTRTLLDAEARAGVAHHVVLSVVGANRVTQAGYYRAKAVQEQLVERGPVPFTIVRATQFFEFVGTIADVATSGGVVRVPPVLVRPVAVADVAAALAAVAVAPPVQGVVEVAGPDELRLDELVRRWLERRGDARTVVADPDGRYFGARLEERSLLPSADVVVGATRLDEWLARGALTPAR
jgi:uncharacterized protein YbjT (DUF2867 family)